MQRVLRQPENPALPESGGEHYDGLAGFSEGASWRVKKWVVDHLGCPGIPRVPSVRTVCVCGDIEEAIRLWK